MTGQESSLEVLASVNSSETRDGFISQRMPKVGADFGERTVIRTFRDGGIIFGKAVGCYRNCGAWLTSIKEWNEYVDSLWETKPRDEFEGVASDMTSKELPLTQNEFERWATS